MAVASRPAGQLSTLSAADEHDLRLDGFLVFLDPPKAGAADSLRRLAALGITVKIATGDNAVVAEKVCADLGLASGGTLTGKDIDALDDAGLTTAATTATIFARVSPEQKARLVRLLRQGHDVGFLGDGVNDALALHAADVGLSVDTAADVAKDAADVVLLEKDLGVLADGVAEGRRIFANTIKYVLMGTSSNFGNMFSAASASAGVEIPAHAARADPAQQPALRLQPARHPHRPRRRRTTHRTRRTGTSRSSAGSCSSSAR